MNDNIIHFPGREPAQDTHEPLEVFTQEATDLGLIRPGDKLDQNMVDFAYRIVSRCADLVEGYQLPDEESSAGEHIRAVYGEA